MVWKKLVGAALLPLAAQAQQPGTEEEGTVYLTAASCALLLAPLNIELQPGHDDFLIGPEAVDYAPFLKMARYYKNGIGYTANDGEALDPDTVSVMIKHDGNYPTPACEIESTENLNAVFCTNKCYRFEAQERSPLSPPAGREHLVPGSPFEAPADDNNADDGGAPPPPEDLLNGPGGDDNAGGADDNGGGGGYRQL